MGYSLKSAKGKKQVNKDMNLIITFPNLGGSLPSDIKPVASKESKI